MEKFSIKSDKSWGCLGLGLVCAILAWFGFIIWVILKVVNWLTSK